jgi:hypothetical protein
MAALTTGKTIEIIFEKAIETFEDQDLLLPLVTQITPDKGKLQNSGNVIWRPVEQHRPIQSGWSMSGLKQGIIQEEYPAVLGTPQNDVVELRVDDMRDITFWENSARKGAIQQATVLNTAIATDIKNQGSLYYRSNETSGLDFISSAQVIMNERQATKTDGRYFLLNDRDNKTFASDLGARQTLQGMPEQVWKTGQLTQNVCEFDVFTGSFLPLLTGGAAISTTVTGNQSFAPQGGTVNTTTKVVTNVDYREMDVPVAASASYSVGDKVNISNGATTIKALGLSDKVNTGEAMTFTVISKPDATTLKLFPKAIALDDAALSTLQKAYANVDTTMLNGATVDRINSDASARTNLFWEKSAIEVMGGAIPAELFSTFSGKKVLQESMSNGLEMYMLYDGDITEMTFEYRIFVWYGITVCNPSNCGVAITY